jgi:hypothetical protein
MVEQLSPETLEPSGFVGIGDAAGEIEFSSSSPVSFGGMGSLWHTTEERSGNRIGL